MKHKYLAFLFKAYKSFCWFEMKRLIWSWLLWSCNSWSLQTFSISCFLLSFYINFLVFYVSNLGKWLENSKCKNILHVNMMWTLILFDIFIKWRWYWFQNNIILKCFYLKNLQKTLNLSHTWIIFALKVLLL